MDFEGEKIETKTGVPQGSCLSPVLWNLFIHDLDEYLPQDGVGFNSNRIKPLLFADDLVLVIEGEEYLKKTLKGLRKWADVNKLTINNKKSGILRIKMD